MFLFESQIVIGISVLFCGVALLAWLLKQRIKKVWESPESEIYAIWVPTDDPINDRCEFFCSKDPRSRG